MDPAQRPEPARRRGTRRRRVLIGVGAALVVLVVAGGLWVRHERTWAEPIAYEPPPGDRTGPGPAPNASWRKDGGTFTGPIALGDGRTATNDRELVLASAGGPPREASPESGCGADIVGVVVEDSPDKVVVQGRTYAGRNEGAGLLDRMTVTCNGMRYQRTMTVQLPTPLAGRPVFDDAEAFDPLVIVDGSTLLVPGWVPDGYELHGETIAGGSSTFTYGLGPVVGPGREGGVQNPGLSVSQGSTLALVPPPFGDEPPPAVDQLLTTFEGAGRSVTVRGVRGAIVRTSPLLPVSLIWHEDDRWFAVSFVSDLGSDDPGPSDDDLLRTAESLHRVGP